MRGAARLLSGPAAGLLAALAGAGACQCGSGSTAEPDYTDATAPDGAAPEAAAADGDAAGERDGSDGRDAEGATGPTTWWDDPTIWSPVPKGERCNLYQADPAKANVPSRVWTSCGPGCLEAPANLEIPINNGVNRPASSGSSVGDEIYFRLAGGWEEKQFMHVARISDGATMAMVAFRDSPPACGAPGLYSQNAALFLPILMLAPEPSALAGWVRRTSPPSTEWATDWIAAPNTSTAIFAWEIGWALAGMDGKVRVAEAGSAQQPSVIAQSAAPLFSGFGRDDAAIWPMLPDAGGHETLWGFDTVARELVAQEARVLRVAMSQDRMTWIGVHGPQQAQGTYAAAELYWSPRTVVPSDVVIHQGPSLPATSGLLTLVTAGDFAVTLGCATDTCDLRWLFVARLSTSQLWQIPMRPGKRYIDAVTASPAEVLLGEVDDPGVAGEGHTYRRLVRLQFDHLDELEHAW